MKPRTSQTHPLQIGTVETLEGGGIGLTFCPGKHDPHAVTGPWARDLAADLAAISDWGALALVTLLEDHELELLNVPGLGEAAKAADLSWLHLPIRDVSIPGPIFERLWQQVYGARLRTSLMRGESIVVHCRGGLGRTGLVAARLLIEMGESPVLALDKVRTARPGAVETSEPEQYVLGLTPI